jgi:ABC-type dipeptide/oligopeptide/nickel transport system ATPase component
MTSKFKDEIKDWYKIAGKSGCGIKFKNDKNFSKHYIKPCQMISIIGQTGSGKSKAVLEFLSRKNDAFYDITVFSGSSVDEPLYHLLEEHIDGINMIDDVDELPELDMNEEDKKHEKLMIWDDIINLPKKQLIKIQKWFNSSRKAGYTNIIMAQNYTDLPIQIRRNTMIFMIFRLNDINSINQILKNHNNNGDDKDLVKEAYFLATKDKGNFFTLDLNAEGKERYRRNFLDFIEIPK